MLYRLIEPHLQFFGLYDAEYPVDKVSDVLKLILGGVIYPLSPKSNSQLDKHIEGMF